MVSTFTSIYLFTILLIKQYLIHIQKVTYISLFEELNPEIKHL